MRRRPSFEVWTARLLAALSLPTAFIACGDSGPGASEFPCDSPEPLVAGSDTGYERCARGYIHRPSVAECKSTIPRTEEVCPADLGGCSTDADCTGTPKDFCSNSGFEGCTCQTGCTADADCGSGRICVCGDPIGRCVTADCTKDADCGDGLCASSLVGDAGCASTEFHCQMPDDECGGDSDCGEGQQCIFSGSIRRCEETNCAIGRPFLIEGAERTASPVTRGDWAVAAGSLPAVQHLSAAERRELAEHWTRAALMEHASVAAFARFALQLLALGAPPNLVLRTQAAMADETEHARLCFALATAYGGQPVGPGPLSLEGALDGSDLLGILTAALLEGCIGETVAAIEATEAAAMTADRGVRDLLHRISEDEARHAELAWSFVQWAIEQHPGAREHARRVLNAEIEASRAPAEVDGSDERWLALGRVTEAMHRHIRREALRCVVAPCARALFEASPSADTADTAERRPSGTAPSPA